MHMATKRDRMLTNIEKFHLTMLLCALFPWSFNITWQAKTIIYWLPQSPWLPNLEGWESVISLLQKYRWLPNLGSRPLIMKIFHQQSYTGFWRCGHVRLRENWKHYMFTTTVLMTTKLEIVTCNEKFPSQKSGEQLNKFAYLDTWKIKYLHRHSCYCLDQIRNCWINTAEPKFISTMWTMLH